MSAAPDTQGSDERKFKQVGTRPIRHDGLDKVTGRARFGADLYAPGMLHGVFVRSPHAHARIERIDAGAARAASGALLVLTAADIADDIVKPLPSFNRTPPFDVRNADGSEIALGEQYPLARDRVRYVGEPVAFVVAETALNVFAAPHRRGRVMGRRPYSCTCAYRQAGDGLLPA